MRPCASGIASASSPAAAAGSAGRIAARPGRRGRPRGRRGAHAPRSARRRPREIRAAGGEALAVDARRHRRRRVRSRPSPGPATRSGAWRSSCTPPASRPCAGARSSTASTPSAASSTSTSTGAFAVTARRGRRTCWPAAAPCCMVASTLASAGSPRLAGYGASKAGLAQLARTLAREWADRGVRVNALAPGYVETRMTERAAGRRPAARRDPGDDAAGPARRRRRGRAPPRCSCSPTRRPTLRAPCSPSTEGWRA